jgi:acyl carrier protein
MAREPIPATTDLEQQLLALVSGRLLEPRAPFTADCDLYDAGLDSMAIMRLLVIIEEEYGVSIPERDLTRHNFSTIRHLAHLIRERSAPSVQ